MDMLRNLAKSPSLRKKSKNTPKYGLGVTLLHGLLHVEVNEASDLPDMEGLLDLKAQFFAY